jgi:hypothetical protein
MPENNEIGIADQPKLHSPEGAKNNRKWGCRRGDARYHIQGARDTPWGAARIARQTLSGVAGLSIWVMPSGLELRYQARGS